MAFIERFAQTTRDVAAMGPGFYLTRLRRRRRGERVAVRVRGVGELLTRHKSGDISILRQIFGERQYDLSGLPQQAVVQARYEALLARGVRPVIVDAGANIGASSIWFAQLYPRALVIAVEPDAGNAELCRLNCGGHANITVREAAIGAAPGSVRLNSENRKACAIETVRDAEGGVEIVSLDQIRAELGAENALFIVKIDIEGFEEDLFSRNLGWLDDPCLVIVEPHDWLFPDRDTSLAFQTAMAGARFQILLKGENLIYVRRPGPPAS